MRFGKHLHPSLTIANMATSKDHHFVDLMNFVYKVIDKEMEVTAAIIDLCQASDLIDHAILRKCCSFKSTKHG